MKTLRLLTALGLLTLAGAAAPAAAECLLTGEITASLNDDDPAHGMWRYTLEVTWDTGDPTALSHLDLIVDAPGGNCECSQIVDALNFADIAGTSTGEPMDCMVDYYAMVECHGDPSIPGDEGIIIKWEPLTMPDQCEPGPTGTGTFVFFSDYAPGPVDEDLPLLLEKNSGESCEGTISGVFPALECGPVSTEATTWSELKGQYGR
jgi:hypothetical protein